MTRPFRLTAPVPLERDTHVAVAKALSWVSTIDAEQEALPL